MVPFLRRDEIVVLALERQRGGGEMCSHPTCILTLSPVRTAECVCATCLARWAAVVAPGVEPLIGASSTCATCGELVGKPMPNCADHELHAAALAVLAFGDDARLRRAALRYAASFLGSLPGPGSPVLAEIIALLTRAALVE